jgi:hypothetical protein
LFGESIQDGCQWFVGHLESDAGVQRLFGSDFCPGLPLDGMQNVGERNIAAMPR